MNQWIALQTLVRREVIRFLRIWTQTLLPSPISMVLYFVVFGSLIGPRIGQLDGFDYIQYMAPGLIMMAIINNSYSNVVASFFGAKFARNIEEMYVSPMSSTIILFGFVIGSVLRGLITACIVTVVALFFTHIELYSLTITITVALLTAILFALAGILNGIFAQKFDDINIIPTFILTPLTYLGGVFYSVNMLPEVWQVVSHFNPILYVINAFRYGMLGVSDVGIGVAIPFLLGCIAVFFTIAQVLLYKGYGVRA